MTYLDSIILITIWIIISIGIIGAYAMTLSKVMILTSGENGIDYSKFFYPGMLNIIGYSFVGFLWGLELRRLLSREGPFMHLHMNWKDKPAICAIATFEFVGIWLLLGYLIL